jgi:hypothetical protein
MCIYDKNLQELFLSFGIFLTALNFDMKCFVWTFCLLLPGFWRFFAACLMVVVFLDHTWGCFFGCCFITPTSSQLSSEFLSYDCVAGGWNLFFFWVFKPCMWRPAVTIATGDHQDYGYSSVFGLIQVGAWEVGVEEAAVQSCTWDRESDEKSKLLLKGEVTRRDLQQIIKEHWSRSAAMAGSECFHKLSDRLLQTIFLHLLLAGSWWSQRGVIAS